MINLINPSRDSELSSFFPNLAEDVRRAESRDHPRQAVRHGGPAAAIERHGAPAGPRREALREGQERQGQVKRDHQSGHGGHREIANRENITKEPLRRRRRQR